MRSAWNSGIRSSTTAVCSTNFSAMVSSGYSTFLTIAGDYVQRVFDCARSLLMIGDSVSLEWQRRLDRVRVLRIRCGPGRESKMRQHPASVLVFLTDGQARFVAPDGLTESFHWKAGDAW